MWSHVGFDRTPPLDSVIAAAMRKAGCPEAVISDESYHRHWTEIHNWCEEHFGKSYSWCGNTFFFTNHDDRSATGTLIHVFESYHGLSLLNTKESTNGLSNFYVIFPSEEEAMMFILRWS